MANMIRRKCVKAALSMVSGCSNLRGFLTLSVVISLAALGCSESREALSQENLAASLKVKIIAPVQAPGAEATLLRSLEPVALRVEIEDSVAQTFQLRQKSAQGEWKCSGGNIRPSREAREILWTPPDRSQTATITFTYHGAYNKFPRSIFHADLEAEGKASCAFITPTPGSRLRNGVLDGLRIGEYLNPNDEASVHKYAPQAQWYKKYPERYAPPKFFYKVTKENRNLKISEHFTLGDFALDYPWFSLGLPQYIALDYDIVEKVEDLLRLMQQDGLAQHGFKFVYAFRPPAYNLSSIIRDGEETLKAPFSMHQYGRAVDLIVDEDNDLVMDDLNGDGAIDIHDAGVIMHYVNILDRRYREEGSPMVGGAGLYSRNDFPERVQTPYIHIDVRGFLDDQGHLIRWPAKFPDGTPIRFADL